MKRGRPPKKGFSPKMDLLDVPEVKGVDPAVVARAKELEKIILGARDMEKVYKETNKIEFWKPWPHQQQTVDLIHSGKKVVLIQGGNRIGKTVLGSNVVGSFSLGIQPWDKKDTIFGSEPTNGRIICQDWEKHAKGVVVPALKEWLPRDEYKTTKNNLGIEAWWEFKNKSKFELITNKEETKSHEGWKGHWVWADEPPDREKFVANKRGLLDYSGIFLLTMTAVSASWILDDIVLNEDPSIGSILEVPMRANPLLSEGDIKSFEAMLTDDEKLSRIQGGWLNLTGRVLKEFDKNIHWVEPFQIPVDWPVVAMIDLHLKKPQAISFYAFDPMERQYVIDEVWDHLTPEECADAIVRRKKANVWNIHNVFIDPLSKGDTNYIKNRMYDIQDSFTIISHKLAAHGIILNVASKDKDSGVMNVKKGLKGINKLPSLFFFNTCKRHLWEIQRWVYDEEGLPIKENDDMMENLYRSTLTGIKWAPARSAYNMQQRYDRKMQEAMV